MTIEKKYIISDTLQQYIDWENIIKIIKKYELQNFIYPGFILLKYFFHSAIPRTFLDDIKPNKLILKYFKNKITHWFPNAYPSDLIYPMNDVIKKYDVGFCGNVNNRNSWIDLIASNFKLKKDIFVIGNEMVKTINEYTIHFNRNIADDINYRTFETLGCNTFILTNETPGLNQLFEIGKNIITYNNENDLLDKIKFYLENDSEREQTTKLGYEHVTNNHTFFNRADLLLKIIKLLNLKRE